MAKGRVETLGNHALNTTIINLHSNYSSSGKFQAQQKCSTRRTSPSPLFLFCLQFWQNITHASGDGVAIYVRNHCSHQTFQALNITSISHDEAGAQGPLLSYHRQVGCLHFSPPVMLYLLSFSYLTLPIFSRKHMSC